MTPQQIRDAIDADPALTAMAQAGQWPALAAALSVGSTTTGNVTTKRFLAWTAQTGLRAFVEDTAADKTHPLRASSLAIKDVLVGAVDGVDLSDPGNQVILGAWVAYGAISQAQADDLIGYAQQPAPISEHAVRAAVEGA
jgi:hypothetical protein